MNQEHQWPLKKDDFTLIEGVFNFISFLRNHDLVKVHAEAPEVLDQIQEVFEKMPAHTPGVDIALDFTLRHKDSDVEQNLVEGIETYCQYWCVDLNKDTLEIYSSTINTNTMPQDNPASLEFILHLGKPNGNIPSYYEEWKEEVKNPEVFWSQDYEREITIEFNEKKFWI